MSTVAARVAVVDSRTVNVRPAPDAPVRGRRSEPFRYDVRPATGTDAAPIHELIARHIAEGRLLPRPACDIEAHVDRFVVAVSDDRVIGCADLAPLSDSVGEVRSLVITDAARSQGVGRRILNELVARATAAGFRKLCAFTHSPRYFVRMGFSVVPHAWVPEKIEKDCAACAHFRQCGQYAVVLPLGRTPQTCVPLASLHG